MKFLFLGLIFGSISYIGFQYGNSYKEKENFYNEFSKFLLYLKSQITFLKIDLFTIFKAFETKDKNLKFLLKNIESNLKENKKIKINILTLEENLALNDFFNNLGKSDCITQEEFISHQIDFFEAKLKESKDANLRYGNMYKKLGVLAAFLVCIVLI